METAREKSHKSKRSLRLWITASSIFGLGSLNVATLIHDGAHQYAYSGIQNILGVADTLLMRFGAEAVSHKLLAQSPTTKQEVHIKQATAGIRTELDTERSAHRTLQNSHRTEIERHQALAAKHRDLDSRHQAVLKSYGDLEARHANLDSKHAALTKQQSQQAAIAKRVSERITPRITNTARRSASSLPAKVAPIVGTIMAAGMTLWDIKDMCDTLRDMNELKSAHGLPATDHSSVCGMKLPGR